MNSKLDSEDIIKLLNCLIGEVRPYGDSVVDMSRECNFGIMLDVAVWLFDSIIEVSYDTKINLASCERIINKAKEFIKSYNEIFTDILSEG